MEGVRGRSPLLALLLPRACQLHACPSKMSARAPAARIFSQLQLLLPVNCYREPRLLNSSCILIEPADHPLTTGLFPVCGCGLVDVYVYLMDGS